MADIARLRDFISGRYADAATDTFEDVADPATAAVIAQAPVSASVDADAAHPAADAAFRPSWGRTSSGEREVALRRFAGRIESRAGEFVALEASQTDKPLSLTASVEEYFYAPTVVSGLRQDDEAIQSEIFGPVITVPSTPTSRWSPRCRMVVSRAAGTARTCPGTGSRTTPGSST